MSRLALVLLMVILILAPFVKGAYLNDTDCGIEMRPSGAIGMYYGRKRNLQIYWNWRLKENEGMEVFDLTFSFGTVRIAGKP